MERAWKNVKANRGAPGPMHYLEGVLSHLPLSLADVRQQLLEGNYEPSPARRKSIRNQMARNVTWYSNIKTD